MFIQNCKISVPPKSWYLARIFSLIPSSHALDMQGCLGNVMTIIVTVVNCDHYHQHHHDHHRICCHHHPHRHPDLNQITCGGWDTERRGSGVRRRLPALSTLKRKMMFTNMLMMAMMLLVVMIITMRMNDHDVDERNLQGWSRLPSQITWRNWTNREGTPIS